MWTPLSRGEPGTPMNIWTAAERLGQYGNTAHGFDSTLQAQSLIAQIHVFTFPGAILITLDATSASVRLTCRWPERTVLQKSNTETVYPIKATRTDHSRWHLLLII